MALVEAQDFVTLVGVAFGEVSQATRGQVTLVDSYVYQNHAVFVFQRCPEGPLLGEDVDIDEMKLQFRGMTIKALAEIVAMEYLIEPRAAGSLKPEKTLLLTGTLLPVHWQ